LQIGSIVPIMPVSEHGAYMYLQICQEEGTWRAGCVHCARCS